MEELTKQNGQLNDTLRQLTASADQLAELQKQNDVQDQAQKKLIATLNKRIEELELQIKKLVSEKGETSQKSKDELLKAKQDYDDIENKYKIMKKKLKREKEENEKLAKKQDESTFLTATADAEAGS